MKVRLNGLSDYAAFGLLLIVMGTVTWIVVGTVLVWLGRLVSAVLP